MQYIVLVEFTDARAGKDCLSVFLYNTDHKSTGDYIYHGIFCEVSPSQDIIDESIKILIKNPGVRQMPKDEIVLQTLVGTLPSCATTENEEIIHGLFTSSVDREYIDISKLDISKLDISKLDISKLDIITRHIRQTC
jgi:hypothetical protein